MKSRNDNKLQTTLDLQEIAHAVSSQKILSKEDYKKHYKDHMLGQAPHDPAMAYPEYQHMREVSEKIRPVRQAGLMTINSASKHSYTFQANYRKEADEQKQRVQIPPDHPDFLRAKQAAKNLSDVNRHM